MTPQGTRVPDERETEPWYRAVCELWDDAARYETIGARGRTIAAGRYSEAVARARHIEYFTSLERREPLFDAPGPSFP
jgi:hypothetical protein